MKNQLIKLFLLLCLSLFGVVFWFFILYLISNLLLFKLDFQQLLFKNDFWIVVVCVVFVNNFIIEEILKLKE